MRFPPDRWLDSRWNAALDALIAAWGEPGPDVALACLRGLAGSQVAAGDVALGEVRAGVCGGCGKSRYLNADGGIITHRSAGGECAGSNRLPAEDEPGDVKSAAREGVA